MHGKLELGQLSPPASTSNPANSLTHDTSAADRHRAMTDTMAAYRPYPLMLLGLVGAVPFWLGVVGSGMIRLTEPSAL
jgi:hypothetical protein